MNQWGARAPGPGLASAVQLTGNTRKDLWHRLRIPRGAGGGAMAGTDGNGIERALAGAGDGAFVIGDDRRIRSWNRAAETLLGYTPREVVGHPCCDVFNGYNSDGNRLCSASCQILAQVRSKEPVQHFDMRTRTKAGRPVWLNMSVLTTTSPGGEPLTIHLFRDVTASKELLTLVHERLGGANVAGAAEPAAELSRRELEVLRLMTQGL